MRALSLCALTVLVGWSWACDDGDGTQPGDGGRDGAADRAPAAGDAGDAGAAVTDAPAEASGPGDSGIADQKPPGDAPPGPDGPLPAAGKVDILFVVDNSGSMAQEQANLAGNFPVLMQELVSAGADLHIAVVSSDLGAGPGPALPGCPQTGGDRGVFCRAGALDFCARCGVDISGGRFLRTATPNFQGNIGDVFACMARIGTFGCGFEHTVGALERALTAPENAGFLRADAFLAFVIITDEDDCTAAPDSALFAAPIAGQDLSLRCAIEGHVCGGRHNTGAEDVNLPLAECQAASDGALLPLSQLIASVSRVKSDPRLIIAAGIFGWPLPAQEATARYRIITGPYMPPTRSLAPVCQSSNGEAAPGQRVKRFVESFANHGSYSICQDDFRAAMRLIGEKIRTTMRP